MQQHDYDNYQSLQHSHALDFINSDVADTESLAPSRQEPELDHKQRNLANSVPNGSDSHDYELSARDTLRIRERGVPARPGCETRENRAAGASE